jgi:hypothetical protein
MHFTLGERDTGNQLTGGVTTLYEAQITFYYFVQKKVYDKKISFTTEAFI